MPSSNKTPNYGLNMWSGSDRPKREDFNADNSIIDTALKKKSDKIRPSIINVTLSTDISGSLKYAINQEGLVKVWGTINKVDGAAFPQGATSIGLLPIPIEATPNMIQAGTSPTSTYTDTFASAQVQANGNLRCLVAFNPAPKYVTMSFSYYTSLA